MERPIDRIARIMREEAGRWPRDPNAPTRGSKVNTRRNGMVFQGQHGDHMIRVTEERTEQADAKVYRLTIGLNFSKGNTHGDYTEWTSKREFLLAQDAWAHGVKLARGATNQAEND